MTAQEHNKLLGIFLLVQGGLQVFGGLIVVLMYGGMGIAFMSSARRSEEQTVGGIFIVLAIVIGLVIFLFAGLALISGLKLLKEKPGARPWGIVASIVSLMGFPLGTALGVYGLWFLFGDEGKKFYAGGREQQMFSQPQPPNNWQ